MEHIFSSINHNLRRKKFDTQLIARVALNELAKFLDYDQLEGYLRYHILYVDLPAEEDKILVFQNKMIWLKHINESIQLYDPDKVINDIRHKKLTTKEGEEL